MHVGDTPSNCDILEPSTAKQEPRSDHTEPIYSTSPWKGQQLNAQVETAKDERVDTYSDNRSGAFEMTITTAKTEMQARLAHNIVNQ